MSESYKPIISMKEVPEYLRKFRRQYLRYQQAEIIYSISHKKLLELASDAGAIYRIDGTVLIRRDIFEDYLERFHEPATGKDKEKKDRRRSIPSSSFSDISRNTARHSPGLSWDFLRAAPCPCLPRSRMLTFLPVSAQADE